MAEIVHSISPSRGDDSPTVVGFYEPDTGSCQYICIDEVTRKCAVIDVVQQFDPKSFATGFDHPKWALDYIDQHDLELEWILDTHPHADHFIAADWLREKTGVQTAIGEKVREIAVLWREYYNLPDAFPIEPHFDRLFADGDTFKIGNLDVRVMLSPGHTLGSITYVVGDAIFAHDTLMQPDAGTSRADFPGGSAAQLYDSIMAILDYPESHRIFVGHDYGTKNRENAAWESTVGEQKADNIHVGGGVSKDEYVKVREQRDKTLSLPDRMLAALQVNLRDGRLPDAESDGHSYLKMPINRF
ncbi:Beta-lactamase domain protein [Sulfitobacter noctilucicola]|uniref:Glyoxylase-like metal-dependent hydrolase (Beta-lactamase superfamily II) n=1 Tax=Sulfitobacter noctilucicola TaxID=1342301 RepID=A0A7W6M6W4_9RHOB|nr:MBL fold metallo-hydrolase [Sulfitobacter noctilucicola]KIN62888.1 Beta-lactamase domain protein [Sulfitobacter noctilucicola]MBB4172581.1 glyoxylase-like metal-dependent hydrolase (beta-lactamase superfamily II) [Sulfitobacter noctilucicola]